MQSVRENEIEYARLQLHILVVADSSFALCNLCRKQKFADVIAAVIESESYCI